MLPPRLLSCLVFRGLVGCEGQKGWFFMSVKPESDPLVFFFFIDVFRVFFSFGSRICRLNKTIVKYS